MDVTSTVDDTFRAARMMRDGRRRGDRGARAATAPTGRSSANAGRCPWRACRPAPTTPSPICASRRSPAWPSASTRRAAWRATRRSPRTRCSRSRSTTARGVTSRWSTPCSPRTPASARAPSGGPRPCARSTSPMPVPRRSGCRPSPDCCSRWAGAIRAAAPWSYARTRPAAG